MACVVLQGQEGEPRSVVEIAPAQPGDEEGHGAGHQDQADEHQDHDDVHVVRCDNVLGGRLVADALLDAGHQRLAYIAGETDVWLEITTLLIPGANDSAADGASVGLVSVPAGFTAVIEPDQRLIREQILVAGGVPISGKNYVRKLHSIECRINAEDPTNFMPCPGDITQLHLPGGPGVRVDTHLYNGYRVPQYYDSMIGKLITWGETRDVAIARMSGALAELVVDGIETNTLLHREIFQHQAFKQGGTDIHYLEKRLGL